MRMAYRTIIQGTPYHIRLRLLSDARTQTSMLGLFDSLELRIMGALF